MTSSPVRPYEPPPLKMVAMPDRDCALCPRLAEFRDQCREKYPDKHNAPVLPFGPTTAELLIIGLAPGLKGANFTGRPFTGDYAGDLLYSTLDKFGFSKGVFKARSDDGVELINCRITNAVKCLPPQNKPTGAEINTCLNQFLKNELAAMPYLKAILCLGKIAHDATLKVYGHKLSAFKFSHNAQHMIAPGITLFDSYHCSRYNTQTNRLTTAMFHAVFSDIKKTLTN